MLFKSAVSIFLKSTLPSLLVLAILLIAGIASSIKDNSSPISSTSKFNESVVIPKFLRLSFKLLPFCLTVYSITVGIVALRIFDFEILLTGVFNASHTSSVNSTLSFPPLISGKRFSSLTASLTTSNNAPNSFLTDVTPLILVTALVTLFSKFVLSSSVSIFKAFDNAFTAILLIVFNILLIERDNNLLSNKHDCNALPALSFSKVKPLSSTLIGSPSSLSPTKIGIISPI